MIFIRLTGILIAWAVLLQSVEFLILGRSNRERVWSLLRILFSAGLLICGVAGIPFDPAWFAVLALMNWVSLLPFFGLFNGGSDTMGMMLLIALAFTRFEGTTEKVLLWIASLSLLSYFLSGLRKGFHGKWWNGEALKNFILGSPVSLPFGASLLSGAGWLERAGLSVVIAQILGPLLVIAGVAVPWVLLAGVVFHLLNFIFFGLNRFFWVWLATYPAVFWLGSSPLIRASLY
jgi:hypothetical protein